MKQGLFRLLDPIPRDALLIGPEDWIDTATLEQRGAHLLSSPEEASERLREESHRHAGASGAAPSRLILIHQDAFAGEDGGDRLVRWLQELTALRGPYLPILLHGNLPAQKLVAFFRAGLFDAVAVPLDQQQWLNLLIRAEKRLEFRQQSRLVLAGTGQTQDLLRSLRRRLGAETARSAGELLRAHESLEAANRQLTEAMAELSLLYRFGRELSSAQNWDAVLREILENLADFVGAGGASLILRSAPGGSYSPRMTWRWEETAWDKVLVNLKDQVDGAVAESIMAPGVFRLDPPQNASSGSGRRILALPLEHADLRLGYLLLLFVAPEDRNRVSERYLPFLQAVQVILSEEVASAQMLDRIRDIGSFNAHVLETVRSAIWVIDESGSTVFCNRAGQELLTGRPARAITPREFLSQIGRGRQLTPPPVGDTDLPELFLDARIKLDDLQGVLLTALRREEQGEFSGEGTILRDDGERIPVLVHTALMPGRGRDETWLVVVAEDLRETRKLEVERLRTEQLEGLVEMSATLAHEIRNPLMGLSAQAELLAEQLPADDARCRYIEVITGEVERINRTISRMLNYVRPYEPTLAATSLTDLVRDVVDLAQPRADEKDVVLSVLPPHGIRDQADLQLTLDGGQIKQVVLNLLINGIDAAPSGGRVELGLRHEGEFELETVHGTQQLHTGVVIEVADDGPGISDTDLARIFRPFFTTKSTGTGLGLSICQKIIAAHAGEIRVERRDERTFFRVLLPRIDEDAADELREQEEAT